VLFDIRKKALACPCFPIALASLALNHLKPSAAGTPKAYRCQANVTANAVQIEPLGDAVVCVSGWTANLAWGHQWPQDGETEMSCIGFDMKEESSRPPTCLEYDYEFRSVEILEVRGCVSMLNER